MQPGTWLKWYVTDSATRQPIYFRYVGLLRVMSDSVDGTVVDRGMTHIIDSQWHQHLYVNDSFMNWLLPLDEDEVGKFQPRKETVRKESDKPKRNPLANRGMKSASASIPSTYHNWPLPGEVGKREPYWPYGEDI